MKRLPTKVQNLVDELEVEYTLEDQGTRTRVYIEGEYAGFINNRGYDDKHDYKEIISRIRNVVRNKRGQPATSKIGEIVNFKELSMTKESPELLLLRQIADGQKALLEKMENLTAAVELSLETENVGVRRMPRNWVRDLVVSLMADGVSRHIHEMYREISKKEPLVTEAQIGNACVKLHGEEELTRIRTGIYMKDLNA